MDANWKRVRHSDYPELIRGKQLKKRFEKERLIANKNADNKLFDVLAHAVVASEELSKILEKAYATRIIADYYIDVPVDFNNSNRFSLNKIDITEAHN